MPTSALNINSKVTFSHPDIPKNLELYTGMDEIEWEYGLNINAIPTYGGEVIQILSAFVDGCTIKGTTSSNPQLKMIVDWFRKYMEIAGLGGRSETPVMFSYPARGWKLPLWIKTTPRLEYRFDLIAAPWEITAQVLGSTTQNALAEYSMGTYTESIDAKSFFAKPIGFGGLTGANAQRLIDPNAPENSSTEPANYWESLKRAVATAASGDLSFLDGFDAFADPALTFAKTAAELWADVFGSNELVPGGGASAGVTPSSASSGGVGAFLPGAHVTVKGAPASAAQLRRLNNILTVGTEASAPDKVLISAIMAATQESTVGDEPGSYSGSYIGLFQMDADKGSLAERSDDIYASTWFFKHANGTGAIKYAKQHPDWSEGEIAEAVEISGLGSLYAKWKTEATATLAEWHKGGVAAGTPEGTPQNVINTLVVPLAVKHNMRTGTSAAAVNAANAQHSSTTTSGNISDHAGPPDVRWAADMSNSSKGNYDRTAPTPEMDALAADLAKVFNIPWSGSGTVNHSANGFRFQMLYRTDEGGGHWNHVHFGVRVD